MTVPGSCTRRSIRPPDIARSRSATQGRVSLSAVRLESKAIGTPHRTRSCAAAGVTESAEMRTKATAALPAKQRVGRGANAIPSARSRDWRDAC